MNKVYANKIGYTDVTPFEVIKKVSETTMDIQEMDAERDPSWKPEMHAGGFFAHTSNQESQRWFITSSKDEVAFRIRYSKAKGRWQDKWGNRYQLSDKPKRFYDYNF